MLLLGGLDWMGWDGSLDWLGLRAFDGRSWWVGWWGRVALRGEVVVMLEGGEGSWYTCCRDACGMQMCSLTTTIERS